MSTIKKHPFLSVISVNPYNGSYVSGVSNFLNDIKSPEYDKNQFIISYLNTQGYINAHIEISKNILEEDLFDAINNKIYDELALDQALEYQIRYIEVFNNKSYENRHFQVFIAEPSTIEKTYKDAVEKLKYIDVIIPTPLLIKSLYTKEIIQNSGVHCFIYFEENDAFVTIYNEKEFVYTKSLKYTLIQMHERFCEIYGERVEYQDFIKILSDDNLKNRENSYTNFIVKLYKEIFASINDILTYAKRAFEIEKIEHIYIGSQSSTASVLSEIAEVELSIKASDFKFDFGYEQSNKGINQLHALMHIYTTLSEEERYNCNFTIFHRPPNFLQRESGKLLLLIVASFFIAFAYPVSYWTLTYAQELQYKLLETSYAELHIERTIRESTIKSREADKEKILALLNKEKQEYIDKKNTLIKIHDVKVNYPMKAKLLYTLTNDLNDIGVKIESLSYNENNKSKKFLLNLVSSEDKIITALLENLTKKYERKFKFSLEKILYNKESAKYFSELKVTIL